MCFKDSHTNPSISTDLKLSHQFLSFVFSSQKGIHTTKSIKRTTGLEIRF